MTVEIVFRFVGSPGGHFCVTCRWGVSVGQPLRRRPHWVRAPAVCVLLPPPGALSVPLGTLVLLPTGTFWVPFGTLLSTLGSVKVSIVTPPPPSMGIIIILVLDVMLARSSSVLLELLVSLMLRTQGFVVLFEATQL